MVEGDSTSRLDIDSRWALDTGDGGHFKRFSSNPTQDVDIDLAGAITAGEDMHGVFSPFPVCVTNTIFPFLSV